MLIPGGVHHFLYNIFYEGHPVHSLPTYPIPQHQGSTVGFPFYQRDLGHAIFQHSSHPSYQYHPAIGMYPTNPNLQNHYLPVNCPPFQGTPLTYYLALISSVPLQNGHPHEQTYPQGQGEGWGGGIQYIGLLVQIHM